MPDPAIDPDLPGIWFIPGESATYEIDEAGNYHVAAPPQPVTLSADDRTMIWGQDPLDRIGGDARAPMGAWRARNSGEDWLFREDGSFLQRCPDGTRATGIWVIDREGSTLWTREVRGQLETDGARVRFLLGNDRTVTYGYTVDAGAWTLLDPESWEKLVEYRRAAESIGAARAGAAR